MPRGNGTAPGCGEYGNRCASGCSRPVHAIDRTRNLKRGGGRGTLDQIVYSPVKRGSRFSTNAIIASAVSRDENISACATSSNSIASAIV